MLRSRWSFAATMLPSEIRFFNAEGQHIKTESRPEYDYEEVCPKTMKMIDHTRSDAFNYPEAQERRANQGVGDGLFSVRSLERDDDVYAGRHCAGSGVQRARRRDGAVGFVESDLRVRLEDVPAGQWHSPAGVNRGFERFDNTAGGKFSAFSGDWTATIEG